MTPAEVRARFADATQHHFAEPLPGGFLVRAYPNDAWEKVASEIRVEAFPRGETVNFGNVFSPEERENLAALASTIATEPLEHRLVILEGERVVGTFWGMQEAFGRYYMISTAIRPSHQRRGIYSAFLQRLLVLLRDVGFREAYSRHHADNNAVLVPKLKAGFVIAAFEITANFGLLVHLRHPFNERLRAVLAYRVESTHLAPALRAAGVVKETEG
jgi:hypothetical protein